MTTRDITDEDMEIVKEWVEENVPSTYCTPIDKVLDNIVKKPSSVKKISGHKNAISFDFEGRLFVIYETYEKTWLFSNCKPIFSIVEIGHPCCKFCCKQEVLLNVYTELLYALCKTPCEASSIDVEYVSRILPINDTPKEVAHNTLLELCCDYVTPKKVNVYDKVTQVIVVLDGAHVLMERNNKMDFLGNLRRKMMIESTDYSKYIEDDISENMFDEVFNRLIAYK